MKTPRQLLLERHRSMERKLDAIRHEALATVKQRNAPRSPSAAKTDGWREFFLSMRWQLAGLGAAWLVVAWLNSDPAVEPAASARQEKVPAPRQFWTALRENRRQLREMMEIPATEAAPAPEAGPQRRGERPSQTAMA
jgi:hypothetical protein